jgi:hypothetical protein
MDDICIYYLPLNRAAAILLKWKACVRLRMPCSPVKNRRERHFCRTCAIIINSLIDLIARGIKFAAAYIHSFRKSAGNL